MITGVVYTEGELTNTSGTRDNQEQLPVVTITSFELRAVDLPFNKPFKHAEAERTTSDSIFLKCSTDIGVSGFGECLPRVYVSGEDRDSAFDVLRNEVLPTLIGRPFSTFEDVVAYLQRCDGKALDILPTNDPQTAAWCAVDLALLDTFGRAFKFRVADWFQGTHENNYRYSGVLSADKGGGILKSAFRQWLFGLRHLKLKVDSVDDDRTVRLLRNVFLGSLDLRVDANMAWSVDEAIEGMRRMSSAGVRSFEQPIRADDLTGLSRLVAETGLGVMADESITDRESLIQLIDKQACTAVNLRISKCGGLISTLARANESDNAGLTLQVGCQVGESSLLSTAHTILCRSLQSIKYAEGCFGMRLLTSDPVSPLCQFGYGGRPPSLPLNSGFGISVDETLLDRFTHKKANVTR